MRWATWAACLLGLGIFCACVTPSKVRPSPEQLKRNEEGLQFSLKRLSDDSLYSLREDRGQVVLLDVWATWCEPCRDTLPVYEKLGAKYYQQGLRVYAISVDEDVAYVRRFLQENGLRLPVLLDAEANVSEKLFRIEVVPTSMLIDRQGRVRFRHDGIDMGFDVQAEKEIQLLLNEKPTTP